MNFCTQPCADGCPTGMSCKNVPSLGDVCYYVDTPPPGALGAACADATDCAEYLCEASVCTYECNLPAGLFCAAGFDCADHGLGYRCYGAIPVDEGGGGCRASGGSPGPLVVWFGLVGLALRRRRRRA